MRGAVFSALFSSHQQFSNSSPKSQHHDHPIRLHLRGPLGLQPCSDPLPPYPRGLGPVIGQGLGEPFVLQGCFGGDAHFGVVDEDPAEEVEELLVEFGVGGDYSL